MSEKTLPLNEAKLWYLKEMKLIYRFKLFHDHTVFVIFKIIGSYTLVKLLNNYFLKPFSK